MSSFLSVTHLKKAYRARQMIWLISALSLAIFIWAAFATLDEVVVAEGKVVPSQAVQTIQSFEGGIIREILVTEGQRVLSGDRLVILDNTRFQSAFQESLQQMNALVEKQSTLLIELASIKVDFSTKWQEQITLSTTEVNSAHEGVDLSSYRETMVQLDNQLLQASSNIRQQEQRLAEEVSRTASLRHKQKSLADESALISDLVAEGVVPERELMMLERQDIETRGNIQTSLLLQQQYQSSLEQSVKERLNIALSFRAQAQDELDDIEAKIAQLTENRKAVADALARTELRSPVDGIVKHIAKRSLRGVVRSGETIMEIVPIGDKLLIEAQIQPKDIAYLYEGLEATVKFTAFDFVIYGGLKGELKHISADAIQNEDGTTFYKAYIETSEKTLDNRPLIPGMQASVDILTGHKTVLNYWLKPLLRARATALREH